MGFPAAGHPSDGELPPHSEPRRCHAARIRNTGGGSSWSRLCSKRSPSVWSSRTCGRHHPDRNRCLVGPVANLDKTTVEATPPSVLRTQSPKSAEAAPIGAKPAHLDGASQPKPPRCVAEATPMFGRSHVQSWSNAAQIWPRPPEQPAPNAARSTPAPVGQTPPKCTPHQEDPRRLSRSVPFARTLESIVPEVRWSDPSRHGRRKARCLVRSGLG